MNAIIDRISFYSILYSEYNNHFKYYHINFYNALIFYTLLEFISYCLNYFMYKRSYSLKVGSIIIHIGLIIELPKLNSICF